LPKKEKVFLQYSEKIKKFIINPNYISMKGCENTKNIFIYINIKSLQNIKTILKRRRKK